MKDSLAHLPQHKQDESGIGTRYDIHYKITKEQLKELSKYVSKLHEITEKNCKEKIDSFV